jgi:hypothetical protein
LASGFAVKATLVSATVSRRSYGESGRTVVPIMLLQTLAADAQMTSDYGSGNRCGGHGFLEPFWRAIRTIRRPFHIHATEIYELRFTKPQADRLAAMQLDASHLVHMPSHTYYCRDMLRLPRQIALRQIGASISR